MASVDAELTLSRTCTFYSCHLNHLNPFVSLAEVSTKCRFSVMECHNTAHELPRKQQQFRLAFRANNN